ncbi:alpha-ketoglutarate-dependent dioxygenase AlkB [Hymenobacter ruricola]|uniref:Alpha-ketoglutarate-dependent dioxygenase AlkB n=1 Tax=Hymenobacter ruricola TaxID=2791023 RepID=A0ABS0I689_9BACT|nr:alpha-ketoglutarate-dependent dioxygenase AlkB [Hymenobacter ruricola]MBF9222492.1 alpha-ketoglutarate-dependent dioxygenase AlkB [Hymenobacter ruricola]
MNFSLFNPTECVLTLNSAEPIPGLQYLSDYVDSRLQARLLTCIDESPWQDDLKRRVQHYGYRYDYKSRRVDRSQYLGPLPSWCEYYAQQFYAAGYFTDAPPDQVIVNEYEPGQGIAPHIDCTPCFDDTVVSISLGSACIMNLSRADDSTQTFDQVLMPGSTLILQGEARFKWRHGIRPVKADIIKGQRVARQRRVSLTFRKVRLT